jgi:hypothetical protein
MAQTLALKLKQHPQRFGKALRETYGRPIVEKSRRDDFWGAKPDQDETVLRGQNVLGQLLTELRDSLTRNGNDVDQAIREYLREYLQEMNPGSLSINGNPVQVA